MPRGRSYHGPPAPICVGYTPSRRSRWGLSPVILAYLRRLHLPERLGAATIRSASNAHFRPLDKRMTPVTLFVAGIARRRHLDRTLAGETALAGPSGLDRSPSSDRPYDLLRRVTGRHIPASGPH